MRILWWLVLAAGLVAVPLVVVAYRRGALSCVDGLWEERR